MMRTNRFGWLCAALLGTLVLATPGLAGNGSAGVADHQVSGNEIQVTVTNGATPIRSAEVRVTVMLAGGFVATQSKTLSVSSTGGATVSMSFPAPVVEVIVCGLIIEGVDPT